MKNKTIYSIDYCMQTYNKTKKRDFFTFKWYKFLENNAFFG
jgi:hypothetical protein